MLSSASFRNYLSNLFEPSPVKSWKAISGGDINDAFKVQFESGGSYFLKLNSQFKATFFEAESNGLKALRASLAIRIPEIYFYGDFQGQSYLILEWIHPGEKSSSFPRLLAEGLVKLHQQTAQNFGWEQDNYIGSLRQENGWLNSWPEFYAEFRILPKVKMAYDRGLLRKSDLIGVEAFLKAYPSLIPTEEPALLHGDLWSGNVISDENGAPVLIDPSVYYGFREMDLAMMKLFGGFSSGFYSEYNTLFPLEDSWEERIPYHQLYPLLVHLNLFGSSYYADCHRVWKAFT